MFKTLELYINMSRKKDSEHIAIFFVSLIPSKAFIGVDFVKDDFIAFIDRLESKNSHTLSKNMK